MRTLNKNCKVILSCSLLPMAVLLLCLIYSLNSSIVKQTQFAHSVKSKGLNPDSYQGAGLYYYDLESPVLADDLLPLSCQGQDLRRTVSIFYSDKRSGKSFYVPVTDNMDLSIKPDTFHLSQYDFGAFKISYDLLKDFFTAVEGPLKFNNDSVLPAKWSQVAGNTFYYGLSDKNPSHGDFIVNYQCTKYKPNILLIDSEQENLQRSSILFALDPKAPITKQLLHIKDSHQVRLSAFLTLTIIAIVLSSYVVLMTLTPSMLLRVFPVVKNNFVTLATVSLVLVVPQNLFAETMYLALVAGYLGVRYLTIKRVMQEMGS